jgi:ribosomal protein S27AE
MINARNANSKDRKELYRIQEQKVMFKVGFKECPNCEHLTVYRLHEDKSLYCYTCSWKDKEPEVENEELKSALKEVSRLFDNRPRLVKKK